MYKRQVLLIQGWNPVGFWKLFQVGIGEGVIMWVGALPCILIVVQMCIRDRIRAEDMKKGVFSTVGQLPKEEPRKGSIAV